jgi:hypothetical protein
MIDWIRPSEVEMTLSIPPLALPPPSLTTNRDGNGYVKINVNIAMMDGILRSTIDFRFESCGNTCNLVNIAPINVKLTNTTVKNTSPVATPHKNDRNPKQSSLY